MAPGALVAPEYLLVQSGLLGWLRQVEDRAHLQVFKAGLLLPRDAFSR